MIDYYPMPKQQYLERAWEKDGRQQQHHDMIRVGAGDKYFSEETPESLRERLAYQVAREHELKVQIYAMWLQHNDEKDEYAARVRKFAHKAQNVLTKVMHARRKGRKTVRITDLLDGGDS